MEEVGQGVTAEDTDVVQTRGTPHRVTVQVHCVPEEVDLAIGISMPIRTLLVGYEWRLVRRSARLLPWAKV